MHSACVSQQLGEPFGDTHLQRPLAALFLIFRPLTFCKASIHLDKLTAQAKPKAPATSRGLRIRSADSPGLDITRDWDMSTLQLFKRKNM